MCDCVFFYLCVFVFCPIFFVIRTLASVTYISFSISFNFCFTFSSYRIIFISLSVSSRYSDSLLLFPVPGCIILSIFLFILFHFSFLYNSICNIHLLHLFSSLFPGLIYFPNITNCISFVITWYSRGLSTSSVYFLTSLLSPHFTSPHTYLRAPVTEHLVPGVYYR